MDFRKTAHALGLFLLGAILSGIFFFLAAVPLRSARLNTGRMFFLLLTVLISSLMFFAGFYSWGLGFSVLCICIGLYAEIERLNISMFFSALVSILTPFLMLLLTLGFLAKSTHTTIDQLLMTHFDVIFRELSSVYPQSVVDQIKYYLPALSLISLMFVIFFSLAFDPSLARSRNRREWREFTLPNISIWLLILFLAGAVTIKLTFWKILVMNLIIVLMAGYFFQGLAVIQFYMNYYRVGYFWRFLTFALIFTQFFPIISILGLSDYWLEYRKRVGQSKMNFSGR